MTLLTIYALVTLFFFYVLFIRTFVSTVQATELHLTIPPETPLNLDATIGGLAVFADLDLADVKEDLGISPSTYLQPRMTLTQLMAEFDVSEAEVRSAFVAAGRMNGWLVLANSGFWGALGRTLIVVVGSLVLLNVLSVMTGFGLAGLQRRDQRLWFFLYLIRAVVPPMLVILPQFLVIQKLLGGLPGYDSPGLVRDSAQLFTVIFIWAKGGAIPVLLMTTAINKIPKELEDSAVVDGANPWQYFRHIVFPLVRVPMLALTVIFVPIIYNDFLNPLVYLDADNTMVLPLVQSFSGQFSSNFQVLATGAFASVVPLAIVYLVFRKWFERGMLSGAIKG